MVHRPLEDGHGTNSLLPQNGDAALIRVDVKPQNEVEVELGEGVLEAKELGPAILVPFPFELVAMVSSLVEEVPLEGQTKESLDAGGPYFVSTSGCISPLLFKFRQVTAQ